MDFKTLNLLLKSGIDFGHKKIRSCGLNDTEAHICSFVSANPRCSQDDCVKALRLDKTTTAKAVKILEDKKYIVRTQNRIDHRKKELTITPEGKECISEIADLHEKWFQSIFSCLTAQEQKNFEHCCEKLVKAAQKKLGSGE